MRRQPSLSIILTAFSLCLTLFVTYALGEEQTISIKKKVGTGSFLVNSNGNALYYFKKDSRNKSACEGECLKKWSVYCFKPDEVVMGKGLKKSDFGFFMRTGSNPVEQLTYKGKPLYEYIEDVPGEAKGHGLDGLWSVVRP